MHPDELQYPAIYFEGKIYFLERADSRTASYFGGPFQGAIGGLRHGPRQLHHVATINGDAFEPLWHVKGGGSLRLMYGMCYDGCILRYRNSATAIEVLELQPTSSAADWPYPEYPAYLPYFPLRLQRRASCSLEQFAQLACQPVEPLPGEAIVLVPASSLLGMSLWGPSGDAEGVQIVFRCDLTHRMVSAYNHCA